MSDVNSQSVEEYKLLHAEIAGSASSRMKTLAITLGTTCALNSWVIANPNIMLGELVLTAQFIVVFIGLMLTRVAERHIYRVSAYISVFLEPLLEGLNWDTRVSHFRNKSTLVLHTGHSIRLSFIVMLAASCFVVEMSDVQFATNAGKVFLLSASGIFCLTLSVRVLISMFGRRFRETYFAESIKLWKRIRAAEECSAVSQAGVADEKEDVADEKADVLVAIPVYNESSSIGTLVRQILSDVVTHSHQLVVLVYDDGSTDDTTRILADLKREFGAIIRIQIGDVNLGKCHALNELSAQACRFNPRGTIFIDADVVLRDEALTAIVDALETVGEDRIIAGKAVPITKGLSFPLRDIFECKLIAEDNRRVYRKYVNGRIFAIKGTALPLLPKGLKFEDRYLTTEYGKDGIVLCENCEVLYKPPVGIWQYFVERVEAQWNLIELSIYAPGHYVRLCNRRYSFLHSHYFSFPKDVRRRLKATLGFRVLVAKSIDWFINIFARLLGEATYTLLQTLY